MLIENFNVFTIPLTVTDWLLVVEHLDAAPEDFSLLLIGLLVHARNYSVKFLNQPVQMLQIFLEELVSDDLQVSDGVDITLVMHDLLVGESSYDVIDAIDSLNVREEGIAQTFAFGSSRN